MQFPTVATLFHRCYARGFRFKVASSRDERTTRDEWSLKPVEEWRVSVSDRRTMARAQGDRVPWKHSTRNCALTRFHVRPEILPFTLSARRCFSKKISFLSFETTVIIAINYLNFRVFNSFVFDQLFAPCPPSLSSITDPLITTNKIRAYFGKFSTIRSMITRVKSLSILTQPTECSIDNCVQ